MNSSKYVPGDLVCCEIFQISLRSVCVLSCHWSGTPTEGFFVPFFFEDSISGKNRDVIWSVFCKEKAITQQDKRAVTE